MSKPGRQSASDLSTVSSLPKHLDPVDDLTEEQQEIWRNAVRSMTPGFFKAEHIPSLAAYCRHATRERALSKLLETLDPLADGKEYKDVHDWIGKESAKMLAHARSLRLTPQSQYDAQKAKTTQKRASRGTWE